MCGEFHDGVIAGGTGQVEGRGGWWVLCCARHHVPTGLDIAGRGKAGARQGRTDVAQDSH